MQGNLFTQLSNMKKFLIKTIFFIALILSIDFILGISLDFIRNSSQGGSFGKLNFICKSSDKDILIFGSSRAHYHYNSQIIEDKLKMSCFNYGEDGMGIIYFHGLYQIIRKYHKPKTIIYDIHTECDILEEDKTRFIAPLRPYIKDIGSSYFADIDSNDIYKNISYIYRYNSRFEDLLIGIRDSLKLQDMGYKAIDGIYINKPHRKEKENIDQLKLHYLEEFIKLCQSDGIKLLFATSPRYEATPTLVHKPVLILCNKYNIPYLNYYSGNDISNNSLYFADEYHLNREGSSLYSKVIADTLKCFFNKN